MSVKSLVKAVLPERVLLWYHLGLALLAAVVYGWPSEHFLVIGVTGTKGKSTVASMVWSILQAHGIKTGVLSTAVIRIGDESWPNPYKMTMPGRFQIQKWLKRMQRAGCQAVVLETTSQGILQYRHVQVNYDVAVLTNLFPEHIEAHGGFEAYIKAKEQLFIHLSRRRHKTLQGKSQPKIMVVNSDIPQAEQFLRHPADKKVRFSHTGPADLTLNNLADWKVTLPGEHNRLNAVAAAAVAQGLGIPQTVVRQGIEQLKAVPGRMEEFTSSSGVTVVVDYAHEPVSIELLYKTYRERLQATGGQQLICVTGSAGGGRDTSRRPTLGSLAAQYCDQVLVTNEDPYDEDPQTIMQQVADGALRAGKRLKIDLHLIQDRRQAISTAISLARAGDIVLCSGKGSEQAIVFKSGRKLPWDEGQVVRDLLGDL